MPARLYFEGMVLDTNGGKVRIIDYQDSKNVVVKFLNTRTVVTVSMTALKSGRVKDPYVPIKEGVGFFGIGKFSSKTHLKLYRLWAGVMRRGYNETFKQKNLTYEDVKVVKRWHNFQLFCEDIIQMDNWNTPGFDLDKDLMYAGNKTYGPKKCSFVPHEINSLFVGPKSKEVKGVFPARNGWQARLKIHGKDHYIGYFDSKEEAAICYISKKRQHVRRLAKLYRKCLHPKVYDRLSRYA